MEKIFADRAEAVHKEYLERGTFFLERDYITELNRELKLFPRIIGDLLTAGDELRKDPAAAETALAVSRAMEDRQAFMAGLQDLTFPDQYPLFPLLCLLPTIRNTYRFLKDRNVPEDIIAATLGQYEACVFIYQKRYDRLGLNRRYFDWLQHYVDCEILNINRLRFEIMTLKDPVCLLEERDSGTQFLVYGSVAKETRPGKSTGLITGKRVMPDGQLCEQETCFPEEEYKAFIQPGDTCLSVHIPDEGDFSESACEGSYRRALEVFGSCFPELKIMGFHCESWMLSPQLKEYLSPSSNILSFSDKYLKYPVASKGEDVLNFVFLMKYSSYDDLAEDTSLQRKLKKLYQNGGRLYEYGGLRYAAG